MPQVLNVGPTEADLQECTAEELLPREDCEGMLRSIERGQSRASFPIVVLLSAGLFVVLALGWLYREIGLGG